jgi:hypothetical protein
MAHLVQAGEEVKEQLAAAKSDTSFWGKHGSALQSKLTAAEEDNASLKGQLAAAVINIHNLENKVLRLKVAKKNMLADWQHDVTEMGRAWDVLEAEHKADIVAVQQQEASSKAQLAGRVAQLQRLLELNHRDYTYKAMLPPAASGCTKGTLLGVGLRWLRSRVLSI